MFTHQYVVKKTHLWKYFVQKRTFKVRIHVPTKISLAALVTNTTSFFPEQFDLDKLSGEELQRLPVRGIPNGFASE